MVQEFGQKVLTDSPEVPDKITFVYLGHVSVDSRLPKTCRKVVRDMRLSAGMITYKY